MKGMSATTKRDGAPRLTARVCRTMSSIVTDNVSAYPNTVMPRESPTRTASMPLSAINFAVIAS